MKTPVKILVAPSVRMIHEARMHGLQAPESVPMDDPPFRMVNGAPGSDEARRGTKEKLAEAGLVYRSVNHATDETVIAYVAHPEDVEAQKTATQAPRKKPVPRKVR